MEGLALVGPVPGVRLAGQCRSPSRGRAVPRAIVVRYGVHLQGVPLPQVRKCDAGARGRLDAKVALVDGVGGRKGSLRAGGEVDVLDVGEGEAV